MNNDTLRSNPHIEELLRLEENYPDRYDFHEHVKGLLIRMAGDREFLRQVVRRNFDDPGYTSQTWSMYNIPYFHVFETDDLVLKIHLFPAHEHYVEGHAAHAIHHHNNYLLTTFAFFGSGYETFLFDKKVSPGRGSGFDMKVSKHFHQKNHNPSMVDAWEPHVVFIPETLSATLLIWTPERKRTTDSLRNKGILKTIKSPLRKVIQLFGLESTFGIAKSNTLQYYPATNGMGFTGVREEDYFAPTKAETGDKVNDYCMQMIFSFLQKAGLIDMDYLEMLLLRNDLPAYYGKWIQKVINGEQIQEVFHREEINIPQKKYYLQDILRASGQKLSDIQELRN